MAAPFKGWVGGWDGGSNKMVINQKFILHSILNKRSMIPFPPSSTISASLGKPFVAKSNVIEKKRLF